ncbi:MAG: pentapeptide repeat-containing protein [archaeon]
MESENDEKVFENLKCTGAALKSSSFTDCSFINCDLSSCDFTDCRLSGCKFHGCNLSLVKLDGATLSDVIFEECKLVGINFTKCNSKFFFTPHFSKCTISSSNFSDIKAPKIEFTACKIEITDFINSDLSGGNFKKSSLKGCIFHNTNLMKADFTGASEYDIDPTANKIKKAKFSLPEATRLLTALDIIID